MKNKIGKKPEENTTDRRKFLLIAGAAAGLAAVAGLAQKVPSLVDKITGKKSVLRIGWFGQVYAIAPDLIVDGVDDWDQLLQALNALPTGGGKIICYGGNYDFNGHTVSRAINNVTIEGSGMSTYFAGGTPNITAGVQTGWLFKDLRTDAGGLGGTFGTVNFRSKVKIDATLYDDYIVDDTAGGTDASQKPASSNILYDLARDVLKYDLDPNLPVILGTELAPSMIAANWTAGAGWTVKVDPPPYQATRAASAVTTLVPASAIVPNVAKMYLLAFTISSWTAGTITATLGGVVSTAMQGNQVLHLYVNPYTTDNLIFTPDAAFAGIISAVSVKEVTGGVMNIDGDLNFYDSRGHQVRLSYLARHLGEIELNTLLDKSRSSISTSGGVCTYTLYAVYGTTTWDFDGIKYPLGAASASVALIGNTNAAPYTNWVYFKLVGNTPTLTATTSAPTGTYIMVAKFIVGLVSASSTVIYAYNRYRHEVDTFINRVIERIERQGSLYYSGALPTVTATTLSIASGGKWYQGIFQMEGANTVTHAAFYYIKNGVWTAGSALSELLYYYNGDAVSAHKYVNIVWGIVPTTTTAGGTVPTTVKLFAVLQTKPVVEYTLAQARQDIYEATNYYPPNDEMKEAFVPICRTIIDKDTGQFATFDSALYSKDLRGQVTSGGGAPTFYVHPNHSGDVTSAGDGAQTLVATAGVNAIALAAAVQSGAITHEVTKAPTHDAVFDALAGKAPSTGIALSALATQAAYTILANLTSGAAIPTAASIGDVITMLLSLALPENVAILLDPALSADGKYSGICETGTGGAAIAFGSMVYLNSSGKWVVTDADAEATAKGRIGMCVVACGGDTQSITVMFLGKVREDDWDWATVGAPLFLDTTTAGGLTQTPPSGSADCVRIAGFVIDANTVFVQPSPDWLEIP